MRAAASLALLAGLCSPSLAASNSWWKGNLHTHSLWSDGDDFPEMVVAWYKDHGYHFLGLSDHNQMQTATRWLSVTNNRGGEAALRKYLQRFGTNWVERRLENGKAMVRIKKFEEYRGQFEESGCFLLIPSEEISDKFESAPIHLNASNLRDLIPPQGGKSVTDVMQNNINAVLRQRRETDQPIIPHVNHPNFEWAITAEDMFPLKGERFFEVYNGHPVTRNAGDQHHADTERIWDLLLTKRLGELGLEPIWGTAVDDAHVYHTFAIGKSNPGRGWIMVRAEALTAPAIIAAMEAGDFYATSGVRLKEIVRGPKELALKIEPELGITYRTQFIGTRRGYNPTGEPIVVNGQSLRATRRYSREIGAVLAEAEGPAPRYTLKGDELYVRATIISSKRKANPTVAGDFETAWVQPLVTGVK